jgi:hypothetical protein
MARRRAGRDDLRHTRRKIRLQVVHSGRVVFLGSFPYLNGCKMPKRSSIQKMMVFKLTH